MSGVEVITAREVPLGGPRAMSVRRTLPQRQRSLIGAWCFVDHYGPDDVAASGGMHVPPHPHTGLQTVSWLFAGEIEHRDSLGMHALVRPGELNLMTAGRGIAHSEVSTPGATVLHGVQLWLALPEESRGVARDFRHHVPEPVDVDGATVRVLLGTLAGSTSPVPTYSPLLGAEVLLPPGRSVGLDVDPSFEHGLLVDAGDVRLLGTEVERAQVGFVARGAERLSITNEGTDPARMMLLGGTPFEEPLVMWWNFVGRSHEDVVAAREAWEAHDDRFGTVAGFEGPTMRLPAPPLPNARLQPRELHPAATDASAWG